MLKLLNVILLDVFFRIVLNYQFVFNSTSSKTRVVEF